jgi:hypothetical protein
MENLALTKEEAELLIDGLEDLRDEVVEKNHVQLYLNKRVEKLEEIDALIIKLRKVGRS